MSTKNLVLVVTILFLSFAQVASVRAACNPAECGESLLNCTGAGEQCSAKCCMVPGSDGSACFVPGTIVATPTDKQSGGQSGGQATKKIEDIKVGDEVTSFASEGKDKIVNASVSKIYKTHRDYYYELQAGDYGVSVTAEHPFYMGSGIFREVRDLRVGDELQTLKDGKLEKKTITSLKRIDEKTDVYNMTVDNTHTYFANDFAVHNKIGRGVRSPRSVMKPATARRSFGVHQFTCPVGADIQSGQQAVRLHR